MSPSVRTVVASHRLCYVEIHVAELKDLFNGIDPSAFREKDLDPEAEDFIVGWARDLPRAGPLALVVHVDRASHAANAAATLRTAVREFFAHRADAATQRLRQLFRVGRESLLIGLAVLALTLLGGHLVRRSARRVNCRSTWRGAGGRSRSEELRQSSSDCCQVLQGAVAVDAYVDRRAAP